MAKFYLMFESTSLKEFTLAQGGVLTIGRLPDNLIQVDNPAVSGHHAKVYWESDHYVVEDNESLNGTFVNKQRISKVQLNDGDEIMIGKHTVQFKDTWHEDETATDTVQTTLPPLPKLEATVILDTKKAKEMMAAAMAAKASPPPPAPAAGASQAPPAASGQTRMEHKTTAIPPAAPPPRERTAMLTVLAGKTDQPQYMLSSKLTVIGKSDMATVRLKGWFAPNVAATITKRDQKYQIAPADRSIKVMVNGAVINGPTEITEGSMIEVKGVKMSFDLQ